MEPQHQKKCPLNPPFYIPGKFFLNTTIMQQLTFLCCLVRYFDSTNVRKRSYVRLGRRERVRLSTQISSQMSQIFSLRVDKRTHTYLYLEHFVGLVVLWRCVGDAHLSLKTFPMEGRHQWGVRGQYIGVYSFYDIIILVWLYTQE